MKRILIVAAVAAAAAVPATSSADGTSKAAAARGGNDLKISFILRSLDGKPKQIRDFKFKNFTVTCAVGEPKDVDGSIEKMGINNAGKFDGNAKKGDAKVHVEGEVKRNGNVVGILKSSGNFGDSENCRTTVGWKAS